MDQPEDNVDPFQQLLEEAEQREEEASRLEEVSLLFGSFLVARGLEQSYSAERNILSLASLYLLGEAMGRHDRKLLEKHLWDRGLLIAPWTELLHEWFPGEGLTDAELDEHAATFAMRFAQSKRIQDQFTAQLAEYQEFLSDNGHEIDVDDQLVLVQLVKIKLLQRQMGESPTQSSVYEQTVVNLLNSGRDSVAWRLLIQRELLDWMA